MIRSSDLVPGDEIVATAAGGATYRGTVQECDCGTPTCPMLRLATPALAFKPVLTGPDGRLLDGWARVAIVRPAAGVSAL